MPDKAEERVVRTLIDAGQKLLDHFKDTIGLENLVSSDILTDLRRKEHEQLRKIENVLPKACDLGNEFDYILEEIKSIFRDSLYAVFKRLPPETPNRSVNIQKRLRIQKTYNVMVDGLVDVLKLSFEAKKEHLLADIYTEISHSVATELLKEGFWPIYPYMSNEVIKAVQIPARQRPTNVLDSMTNLQTLRNTEYDCLDGVYQRVATHFGITVPQVIFCIMAKRRRNRNTHYDQTIQGYANDYFESQRSYPGLTDFTNYLHLSPIFSQMDKDVAGKVYPHHFRRTKTAYTERFEPGEHVWLRDVTENLWNTAVYVGPAATADMHVVWPYTIDRAQIACLRNRLGKMGEKVDDNDD